MLNIVKGNISDIEVDVVVNSWNQNFIPHWLLIPQGVSKALKKKCGIKHFNLIYKTGFMKLSEARLTIDLENKYFKNMIHVAAINVFWFGTKDSIEKAIINIMKIVNENNFKSVSIPLIGSGTGGLKKEIVKDIILNTLKKIETKANIYIVEY